MKRVLLLTAAVLLGGLAACDNSIPVGDPPPADASVDAGTNWLNGWGDFKPSFVGSRFRNALTWNSNYWDGGYVPMLGALEVYFSDIDDSASWPRDCRSGFDPPAFNFVAVSIYGVNVDGGFASIYPRAYRVGGLDGLVDASATGLVAISGTLTLETLFSDGTAVGTFDFQMAPPGGTTQAPLAGGFVTTQGCLAP